MARRVSIARALCYKSDVYIFDEPFTGLDKSNCQKAINLINSVTKGKTLIVVTHENEYAKLLNCKEINI
jgi:ABC-type multidrug transport system ATPase subunit